MRHLCSFRICVAAALLMLGTGESRANDYQQGYGHSPLELEGRPRASAPAREIVPYSGPHAPGTIVISTSERRLYYILPGNLALKYGVGVGRPGFEWSGTRFVSRKQEWPSWA